MKTMWREEVSFLTLIGWVRFAECRVCPASIQGPIKLSSESTVTAPQSLSLTPELIDFG